MADRIHINHEKAEEHAARTEGAADYLVKVPLTLQDTRTTIPANANSKAAYERSQEGIFRLGVLLDQEVKNIRSLNAAFAQFDEMTGELMKSGSRYSVISPKKQE